MNWLLSVTDYIVEFVPSRQTSKDGVTMEVVEELYLLVFLIPLLGCFDSIELHSSFTCR